MKRLLIYVFFLLTITSCRIFYPSQMLRPGSNYKYSTFSTIARHDEYRIAPYDMVSFNIMPNNGEKLVASGNTSLGQATGIYYQTYSVNVESDGKVKLPIFGRIQISGMTIKEAEKLLEEKFVAYYKEPFIQLKVTNKRVIIIYSSGVGSRVLQINNDNTTLFEALAESGGIIDGKAYKIKLIRGDLSNPQIFKIDLSTIKGVVSSDLVLQANDIIYIENPLRLHQKIVNEFTPYFTLLTTITLVYNLFLKTL